MLSDPDHRIMTSTNEHSCTTCGQEMTVSIQTWSNQWLRTLMARSGFELDLTRDITACNFSQLGEQLLAPHGEKLGMVYLPVLELGDEATCACEGQIEVAKTDSCPRRWYIQRKGP